MVVPRVQWHYSMNHDTNDRIPWTDGTLAFFGSSSNMAVQSRAPPARFLCRQGTVEDVRQKAIELGLSKSGHRTCWLIGPWPVSLVYPVGIRYKSAAVASVTTSGASRAIAFKLLRVSSGPLAKAATRC